MKKNNLTTFLTMIITLLPIIIGIILYDKLPDSIRIRWGFGYHFLSYANKNIVLFIFPIFMVSIQLIILTILKKLKDENKSIPKVINLICWIVPFTTIFVYYITISYALNNNTDIYKLVFLMIGIIFCALGNYIPKMSYEESQKFVHPTPKDEKSFRKITKLFGYSLFGLGLLFLILMFIF